MTENSTIAGTDSFVRSSISRSLRRIARAVRDHRYSSAPTGAGGRPEAEAEVALGECALHVVAHEHARASRRPADQRLEQVDRGGVEVGARLVEQQDGGLVKHGSRGGEALDQPLGEVSHRVVGALLHADRGEQLLDAGGRRLCSRAW